VGPSSEGPGGSSGSDPDVSGRASSATGSAGASATTAGSRAALGPIADAPSPPPIEVRGVTIAYGSFIVQRDLSFIVGRGEIFIIMGGSGCGKSSLLRVMNGLVAPATGDVLIGGQSLWQADDEQREQLMRRFGMLYQMGALWSSMTLLENVTLPLGEFTDLSPVQIREVAALKLALVGLAGFEDFYPSEISGGMRKRAGLARAMALDPDILYLDEPSAGLDPVSSRLLDDLILELRDGLGCTVAIVTHELPSIFGIGDNAVYLDAETRTIIARGNPKRLLEECQDPKVHAFLTRSRASSGGTGSAPPDTAQTR
jgi:phospholipid/cholesterol/gamma-HCH transport system ATP-binding protein